MYVLCAGKRLITGKQPIKIWQIRVWQWRQQMGI